MIGVTAIGYALGADLIDNAGRGIADADLLETKIGVRHVARRREEDASDLAVLAVEDLLNRHSFELAEIECLVVVTQNPDAFGLPHTSAIVHDKLSLNENCAAFDISLGCSGFVYGLSAVTAFMEQNGMSKGLLVTADPYSKVVDDNDRNTSLLFGDAAAATLITDRPLWTAGRYIFGTAGRHRDALVVNRDRTLEMNGRTVFTFSATSIPPAIKKTVEANNLTLDDVDCFLLHQGSKYIVDTIAKRLGVADRTGFHAGEYGNTVSSSLPILMSENIPDDADTVLLAGFGVGLSLGCTVLKRGNHAD